MTRLFYLIPLSLWAIFPIQFSIPDSKIIEEIPLKTRDFATLIPGQLETYIYDDETEYYNGYRQAYFAVTKKKGGWDCLRHYEILASGCIPYFLDLEACDPKTMAFLPRDLILEAMHLEGVSYLNIDHKVFNARRYYEILGQLLEYTRHHLTTKKMGEYILQRAGYDGQGPVLYLSVDPNPDYMRCLSFIALREVLQEKAVDIPKLTHLYKSYVGREHLYGKGFTYACSLDDIFVDRSEIEEKIQNREFELVIYGSVHRGLPYHDLVCEVYEPQQIVYICGEDQHVCEYVQLIHSSPFFLREFEGNCLP